MNTGERKINHIFHSKPTNLHHHYGDRCNGEGDNSISEQVDGGLC